MGSSDITSLALICLALLAFLHSSHAQNSPQDYLDAHNSARSAVGVGPMTWDDEVAAFAQNYANQSAGNCVLKDSGGGGKYGENTVYDYISVYSVTAADVVDGWVREKSNYDYSSNSCVGGECRHYTQVVWRNSVRLGCARVQCGELWWFVTCNYDPPGNRVGQRPFSLHLALVCLPDTDSPEDFLNAHNSARAAVGVGPMTWDANLAAYAQNYAIQHVEDCGLMQSGGGGKYSENIAVGSGDFTGAAAVSLWVGEKSNYNYNSNSCVRGEECGHYTQVVWRNSVRLGCARVWCNIGSWFITCNYEPPGNNLGQRPY